MRKRFAVLLVVLAATAPAAAPVAARAHPLALVPAKTCGPGYVLANLSWGAKCLRAGEFCKVGNREYLKYGFYCPPSGHLRRR